MIHVDRFGNVITNIDAEMLVAMDRTRIDVLIAGRQVHGLKRTYADAASAQLIALIGSAGYLEVALRDGNAAEALGTSIGDEVSLTLDRE